MLIYLTYFTHESCFVVNVLLVEVTVRGKVRQNHVGSQNAHFNTAEVVIFVGYMCKHADLC